MKPEAPKRPHIPLEVKVSAAMRQCLARDINVFQHSRRDGESLRAFLKRLLVLLGLDPATAQLDHNPALGLRLYNPRKRGASRWTPTANDPDYLQWVDKAPHLEKTAGRGGEQMRFGGDTRAVAKTRRLEREPEKWTGLSGPKPRTRTRPAKRRSKPIPQRRDAWPKGRKIRTKTQ